MSGRLPTRQSSLEADGDPVVYFEATGERRAVTSGCFRCGVTPEHVAGLREIIVSPSGKAHFGADFGETDCGIDATRDGWWWPL